MEFSLTFTAIAVAIAKLFVLMLVGYVLYRKGIFDDAFTDKLSLLLVKIIFPALIFTKIVSHFSFREYTYWWILPLLAIGLSVFGMIIGYLVYRIIRGNEASKEFVCSCAFQNCGYLPMNLIIFSFSGILADRFLIYMFLFITGFNLLMWSLVPLFLSGKIKKEFKWSIFLNPPVVATLVSILWVFLFGKNTFPPILFDPLKQLGQAAFPVAMITLGAYLAKYKAYDMDPNMMRSVTASCVVKLLIVPAVILLILRSVSWGIDYKFFLFLQAVMPTAVSLVVIGSYSGANNKFLSGVIFYSHVISIVSIPLWFALFRVIIPG
ncbi:MAG: AEC family transporter [Candidatus Aadella gelida]|nr:AEC family transporter [Candidatus Aadella gelida]